TTRSISYYSNPETHSTDTLSLLDALPISGASYAVWWLMRGDDPDPAQALSFLRGVTVGVVQLVLYLVLTRLFRIREVAEILDPRSEEHTSELQSRENLVCRLLLEKKNKPY